jgi:hypothetical protein
MIRLSFFAVAIATTCLTAATAAHAQNKTPVQQTPKTRQQKGVPVQLSSAQTPLVFEPNRGQAAPEYQWIGLGAGFRLGVGADGATIEFQDRTLATPPKPDLPDASQLMKPREKEKTAESTLVKLRLAGSSVWKPAGAGPTGGISNYFLGNAPAGWHTDIPQYAQVKAAGVYNGIDVVFQENEGALEYNFVVAPGADPREIQIQFEGAADLRVDQATGDLVFGTSGGTQMRHAQPKIYQEVGGKKVSVKGGFQLLKGNTAGFTVEKYDPKRPLVIDPVVVLFTTFLGDTPWFSSYSLAVDGLGNTYVTGTSASGGSGGVDAFVTKLGPTGRILFSTFLGGSDQDEGLGIAVDASGVYVTGSTFSDDFPIRLALQPSKKGDSDAFVTKLSPPGNRIVYSTYLGGQGYESGEAIAVDGSQSAYVTGTTTSQDYPVVLGGYDTTEPNDGKTLHGFVTKLSPAGTILAYSTYLAGSSADLVFGIAVDSSLAAYVTGETCSPNFPFAGYQSQAFSGGCLAFVTKLSPAGDSLIYSTSLGQDREVGWNIFVDTSGNAYVALGFSNALAAKLEPTGKLAYLAPIADSSIAHGIAADPDGNAYVVGWTFSTTFPGAPPIMPNPSAGFLVKLDRNGVGPLYTVFLGARIGGVAVVKPRPRIAEVPSFATIFTTGFRLTPGADRFNGQTAFVVKLTEAPAVVNHP